MNSVVEGLEARSSVDSERAWLTAGLMLILLAATVALIEPLTFLFRSVSRGYNEGWNAFWAAAAVSGGALYMPTESLISNNYPPLSFHIVGFIGQLLGDNVIAGRLVSLVSFAVVSVAAYLLLRGAGLAREIAAAGAIFLLAMFAAYGDNYIAMNDPQMLGHALMLSAAALMWRLDFSRGAVVGGAVLMLLGGFTKHLLIPLPVAMTVWLGLYRRERLASWVSCCAVGILLGLWWTWSRYPPFMSDLLSSRVYLVGQALSSSSHALRRFAPLLLLGGIPLVRGLRAGHAVLSPRTVFVLLYVGVALVIGVLAGGGEGVTRNAYFDLLIASSLFGALGLDCLWTASHPAIEGSAEQTRIDRPGAGAEHRRRPGALRLSPAPAILMVIGVLLALSALVTLPKTLRAVEQADALESETRETIAMIQRLGHGRAACETLALCYWAGGQFTLDFFNYGRKMHTGVLPVHGCTAALQRGDFPVLQVEPDRPREADRLSPCNAAIRQYYVEAYRSSIATLLVPKPPPPRVTFR